MKYINHITLNTGHVRKTYPDEVNKEIYFILKRILRDSMKPSGAEVYQGYTLRTTQDGGSTIATIYHRDGAAILTTLCTKFGDDEAWKILHEYSTAPLATKPTEPIAAPYIADRLEIGAAFHMDAMGWTGDLSRCLGWIVIDPKQIRS
jgi:hypothetical protein